MKKNKNLIYFALLGAAAIAFFVLKKKKDTNKDEKLTNTDVNDTTTTPKIIKDIAQAVKSTPEPLSTILKKGKAIFKKKVKKPIAKDLTVKERVLKAAKEQLAIEKKKGGGGSFITNYVVKNLQTPGIIKKQVKKKPIKKRVKGFDDISVLY